MAAAATAAAGAAAAPAEPARAVARVPTFKTKEQLEQERKKRARARRKKREKEEADRKARELAEEELRQATEAENKRWKDALACLRESSPKLQENPWLIIQEPQFIHKYLNSLSDSFMSFEKHEDETKTFIDILKAVYIVLVEVGKFARYQPSFFLTNPHTIRLFVILLEQVAHAKADNTLFPNVLNILLPTIAKPALYELLADARLITVMMGFARDDWLPGAAVLEMVLGIFKTLSTGNARLREQVLTDDGYDKLRELGAGIRPGLTVSQQEMVQASMSHFPPWQPKQQPIQPQQPTSPAPAPAPAAAVASTAAPVQPAASGAAAGSIQPQPSASMIAASNTTNNSVAGVNEKSVPASASAGVAASGNGTGGSGGAAAAVAVVASHGRMPSAGLDALSVSAAAVNAASPPPAAPTVAAAS